MNGFFKCYQFVFFPFRDELNTAIGEISNVTDNIESVRQVLHCVAKSNTLHTARIKDM